MIDYTKITEEEKDLIWRWARGFEEDTKQEYKFEVLCVAFINQVNNGGLSQWDSNSYSSRAVELAENLAGAKNLLSRPEDKEIVQQVLNILQEANKALETFKEELESAKNSSYGYDYDDDDVDEYDEEQTAYHNLSESLDPLDSRFYKINDRFSEICQKLFDEVVTPATPEFTSEKAQSRRKPRVKLIGEDANAFSIMGRVASALRKAGYSQQEINEYQAKSMGGNYGNVLQVAMEYVEVY
jgi:hypothetical protein